jgi:F/Y-rich N-terminus
VYTADGKELSEARCLRVGALTAMSIGTVRVHRPRFHTESHIFPADYKSIRLHWSGTHVMQRTPYVCKVRHHPRAILVLAILLPLVLLLLLLRTIGLIVLQHWVFLALRPTVLHSSMLDGHHCCVECCIILGHTLRVCFCAINAVITLHLCYNHCYYRCYYTSIIGARHSRHAP